MAKKPSYHYRQSGVIPFRREGDDVRVLLVTSRKQRRWVIPKGIIEEGMTAAESAIKEAHEEAGVVGRVLAAAVGAYEYPKWGGTCRVEVYAMPVEEELPVWPESFRTREWVSLEQAIERVAEPGLKRLLAEIASISAPPAGCGRLSGPGRSVRRARVRFTANEPTKARVVGGAGVVRRFSQSC